MKTPTFTFFMALLLLSIYPLIAMDSELSSDEDETVQLEDNNQSFFVSQLTGALGLLSFGRSAAQSLFSHLTGTENTPSDSQDALFTLFFNKPATFNQLVSRFPNDVNKLIAQHVLRSHPLRAAVKKAIPNYACTAAQTGRLQIRVEDHAGAITAWHLNDEQAGTSCFLGRMGLMEGRVNSRLPLTSQQNLGLTNMTLNQTGDKILIFFADDDPLVLEIKTGKILHTFSENVTKAKRLPFWELTALNNEGNSIAFCSIKNLQIVKINEHRESFCTLGVYSFDVTSLAFNSTGDSLVTGLSDKTARIWNTCTGECIRVLQGHTDGVLSAKYSSTDDKIITAAKDKTARVWNAHTGECILILRGHTNEVISAEFNLAGDKSVTLSNIDSTVIIWDNSSGNPLHILPISIRCTAHTNDYDLCFPRSATFHDGALPDDIITVVNQHAGFKSWSISALNRLTNWLERQRTLQQAMLLVAIYKYRIAPRVLKIRNQQAKQKLLDFNKYPHFEEYFASMPPEIQQLLSRFVIRKTD